MSDIGLILLAAGGSSRMGQPKQLLRWHGVSLLRRAANTALASGCAPIIVVTGAFADRAADELSDLPSALIEPNLQWQLGMGASIRAGLHRALRERPKPDAILMMLCDQPHVEASHLRQLCDTYRATNKPVIASEYAQTIGAPCLFAASCFGDLLGIADSEGAKRLIQGSMERVVIPLPAGSIDVDTPRDYDKLCKGSR